MRFKWAVMIVVGVFFVTGLLLSFNGNFRGAVRLAITGSPVITLSSEGDTTKVMTKMSDGEGFQKLLSLVETEGWFLANQSGSIFVFTRGEESLVLMVKMWTNQYIVGEMIEG
ncbi:hypothetical protein [Sutcliffiella deserti]|uniref:hypothetical protein n=1 Tax=Sutcliffiella deserti TaxID=2875501 RepID=UPI001CBB2122|nr:hypothetical protein [Sutcliffiella deserti]